MKILVNETFSPTLQGEGIHAGKVVGFIRLANCNLACSWCDTPYSWDWQKYDKAEEAVEYEVQDLADLIQLWGVKRIIITGGEPMLQQEAIAELINTIQADSRIPYHIAFDIETNGTIAPTERNDLANLVDTFSVSPKLAHSGDPLKKRIKSFPLYAFIDVQKRYKATVAFKFVCKTVEDLNEVEEIVMRHEMAKSDVWIMPEGATAETHLATLQTLAHSIIDHGFNLSTRVHVLAWGNKRGV